MDLHSSAKHAELKPTVTLSGSAKAGGYGPPVGLVDIGVSADSYIFRVALPGISKKDATLRCVIHRDGSVDMKGIATPQEGILKDSSDVYQTKLQQLVPPGPFSISFKLPGPVDPRLFSPLFRADGILEVLVMKCKA